MFADLQKLAARKLVEAQLRAEININKWEATHALVCQLSKEAEVSIRLPTSLVSEIAKARADLKLADYLGTLKIDQRVVDALRGVTTVSTEEFQSALNQRARTVASIKQGIAQLTNKREKARAAASSAKGTVTYQAERIRKVSFSNPLKEFQLGGCLGSIVVIVFLSSLGTVLGYAAVISVIFVFLVFGLFGYLTFPLTADLLRKWGAASRANEMVRNAETSWAQAMTEAEADFERDSAAAQIALAKAEAHWQKVVEANNRLKHRES